MTFNTEEYKEFLSKYTYDNDFESVEYEEGSGRFEVYGDDLLTIDRLNRNTPQKIWTLVDKGDGIYLVAGKHNQEYIPLSFYITNEFWKDNKEEYLLKKHSL